MDSSNNTFTDLKGGEVWYGLMWPWRVPKILSIKAKAHERASENYLEWSIEDGAGDAFRHAYATAMLAREFGLTAAKEITDLHESGDDNSARRKAMDLHNNKVGIFVYQEESIYGEPSDEELAAAIHKAICSGRMKILKHKP